RSDLDSAQNQTTSFVAVGGPETARPGTCALSRKDLGDGLNTTLMVVEGPDGRFRWMEPRDLEFDPRSYRVDGGPGPGLGSRLGGAGWSRRMRRSAPSPMTSTRTGCEQC